MINSWRGHDLQAEGREEWVSAGEFGNHRHSCNFPFLQLSLEGLIKRGN